MEPVEVRIGGLYSDLYIPEERKLSSVALFVHGGGFSGGSRRQFATMASVLAERFGMISLSIDYHLAPSFSFPVQISDLLSALRWLYESPYGIGPDDIFIIGGSPGACISAVFLMLSGRQLRELTGEDIERPNKAIFLNGIYDLERFYEENPSERPNVDGYIGSTSPEARHAASPSSYIADGLDVLMLHGTEDAIVTPDQCVSFSSLLKESGSRCSIRWFPGEGHAWFNKCDKKAEVASVIGEYIEGYREDRYAVNAR